MTFNVHVHMQMHVRRKVKTGTVTREAPVPPPRHPCCHGVPAGIAGIAGKETAAHHGGGQQPSGAPRPRTRALVVAAPPRPTTRAPLEERH